MNQEKNTRMEKINSFHNEYKNLSENQNISFTNEEIEVLNLLFLQDRRQKKFEIEARKQIILEQQKNMNLMTFIENIKPKLKTQYFYICTTKQYISINRYKFGGVSRRELLKSNLNSYNRGKAAGDKHFYVFIAECFDYRAIENLLKSVLPVQFKDNHSKRNELVHCHYTIFKKIVEQAINQINNFTEKINSSIKDMVHLTTEGETIDLDPINIENLTDMDDGNKVLTDNIVTSGKTTTDKSKIANEKTKTANHYEDKKCNQFNTVTETTDADTADDTKDMLYEKLQLLNKYAFHAKKHY